jgi:hypothetical protein
MKKSSTVAMGRKQIFQQPRLTIGLDLGDRTSHSCMLDEAGNVLLERSLPTTSNGIRQASAGSRVVGSHWKPGRILPG